MLTQAVLPAAMRTIGPAAELLVFLAQRLHLCRKPLHVLLRGRRILLVFSPASRDEENRDEHGNDGKSVAFTAVRSSTIRR